MSVCESRLTWVDKVSTFELDIVTLEGGIVQRTEPCHLWWHLVHHKHLLCYVFTDKNVDNLSTNKAATCNMVAILYIVFCNKIAILYIVFYNKVAIFDIVFCSKVVILYVVFCNKVVILYIVFCNKVAIN